MGWVFVYHSFVCLSDGDFNTIDLFYQPQAEAIAWVRGRA